MHTIFLLLLLKYYTDFRSQFKYFYLVNEVPHNSLIQNTLSKHAKHRKSILTQIEFLFFEDQ